MDIEFQLDDDTFEYYARLGEWTLSEDDVARLSGGTIVFRENDKVIDADVALVDWIVELALLHLDVLSVQATGERFIADIEGTVVTIAWKKGRVGIRGWNDRQPEINVSMQEFGAAVGRAARNLRDVFDKHFVRKELIAHLIEVDDRFRAQREFQ